MPPYGVLLDDLGAIAERYGDKVGLHTDGPNMKFNALLLESWEPWPGPGGENDGRRASTR